MLRCRKNIRLKNFDYRSNYRHFITICTKNRENYLGKLDGEEIILSEIGQTAKNLWLEIPNHFSHVVLDQFIIMPNHIHGIIKLISVATGNQSKEIINSETGTCHGMSQLRHNIPLHNKFGQPLSGSVSVIINQYKSSVKRWCNKNGYKSFSWQSRFYDHIINNRRNLYNIRDYIKSNPHRMRKKDKMAQTKTPDNE